MGIPLVVPRNNEKLDLPHLRRHIPKYSLSNMDAAAVEWWYTFIDKMVASTDAAVAPTTWPCKELLEAISSVPQQALHHQPSLPPQLLSLRLAETDPLPEV
jgi:hypothetical protein